MAFSSMSIGLKNCVLVLYLMQYDWGQCCRHGCPHSHMCQAGVLHAGDVLGRSVMYWGHAVKT